MSIQPYMPRRTYNQWLIKKDIPNNSTYFILSMLIYLMNCIKHENDVVERFKGLLIKYPNIHPFAMGFPKGWEKEPLWK